MDIIDIEYYRRRAAQARLLAEQALSPAIRAIHADMAARYDGLSETGAPARPMLHIARGRD